MSVKIIYFVHGTTTDNQDGKCSGWIDSDLSELGIKQAEGLKDQVRDKSFRIIFCSDLKRSVDSATIGFKNEYPIMIDKRLRECDYGDLTQASEKLINYREHIDEPFSKGESLKDVERRVRDFLQYLKREHDEKYVAIMAHKATQLALEVILNNKTWDQAIENDWRLKKDWQPGWLYEIK